MYKQFTLKSIFLIFLIALSYSNVFAQDTRLINLRIKLESITIEAPGLNEKVDINVSNVLLPDFLRTIANAHKINLNIAQNLNEYSISNNFTNASVLDVLIFICQEFNLTIELTGNILSIKKVDIPAIIVPNRIIPIEYDSINKHISIDLQKDSLPYAFKVIIDKTNKNLVYAPGLENILLSAYIKDMPLQSALEKIAFSNNLAVQKSKDGYYLFDKKDAIFTENLKNRKKRPIQQGKEQYNYYYQIKDTVNYILDVDFENVLLETIISDIGYELNINMFTSTPLKSEGKITINAEDITFDLLLNNLFENTNFTYRVQDNIYYFGKKEDISLRQIITIPLLHRSIEIMKNNDRSTKSLISDYNTGFNNSSYGNQSSINNNSNTSSNSSTNNYSKTETPNDGLLSIFPDEIIQGLDIKVDIELNSFIVSGPSLNVEKFKKFVQYIDKPIPVITIEVMILEVKNSFLLETGIQWGIGEEPVQTSGSVFPATNLTVGASDINKIISGGSSNFLSALNIGKVVPNFYLNIKAMESNGDINIRSTPKLSTLNGHRSNLAIGETTYYVVTQQNYYGSQIPTTSEISNYEPIDAQLSIDLKPLVAGDHQITMEINVVQSTFSGDRVSEEAPPNMNTREFNSIVRVGNQELIMLGGLEEKVNNDSGTGVPVLSRIPVIKWFFSQRKKEEATKKLVILIKPTVFY